jgi:spermidine/putrescine-binding protein
MVEHLRRDHVSRNPHQVCQQPNPFLSRSKINGLWAKCSGYVEEIVAGNFNVGLAWHGGASAVRRRGSKIGASRPEL